MARRVKTFLSSFLSLKKNLQRHQVTNGELSCNFLCLQSLKSLRLISSNVSIKNSSLIFLLEKL